MDYIIHNIYLYYELYNPKYKFILQIVQHIFVLRIV